MMRTTQTLLAVALLGTAVSHPAVARTSSDTAASDAKTYNNSSRKATPDSSRKICATVEAGTGSRISKQECRTRAEWLEMDVEIEEKK